MLLFSCNKKDELKNTFISKKNEFWSYENNCGSHGIFFKFNDDGTYDQFNRYVHEGFNLFNNDGDIVSGQRIWNIKSDSIFSWDNEDYLIKSYNSKVIILTYIHSKEKNRECLITLKKVIDE